MGQAEPSGLQMKKALLLFMSVLVLPLLGKATHIVGGDFYYKQLGTNRYQVTLKLYFDCQNGSPQAIRSDEIAIVSMWNAGTKALIGQEDFTRTGPDYLDKVHYKCLIPEKDICVSEYVYTKVLNINPGTNGVILAFQRCCRNNTINNIIAPESTGATYWIKIPGSSVTTTNSSAVFKELPPNYLCTDAPLKFDHSAEDPDGDSLVYELYQPYTGASRDYPRPDGTAPQPGGGGGWFKGPDFSRIIWGNAYSTSNQVAGSPKLEINSQTGELTLTPNQVGQYVIGIKVKEYRDGVLIGETLRDYQFNVKNCKTTLIANFQTDAGSSALIFACTDTVQFINKSQRAEEYFWDFGDPTTTTDTSSEENPMWVYPGNGDYLVTLTARNEVCEDDYKFVVKIRSKIDVDLGPDLAFCDKVDRFISPRIWDATKIVWNTGQFGPTIRVQDTGTYVATVYYGDCEASDSQRLYFDTVEMNLTPDSLFCTEEEVYLTLDAGVSGPDIRYRWSTGFKDTSRTLTVTEPGTYWVRVENANCRNVDSTSITVAKPEIGDYLFVCNDFRKEFDVGDYNGAQYLWSNGATTRNTILNAAGEHWVRVTYKHCVVSDTIYIENPVINLELGNDTNFCDDLITVLSGPPNMFSYNWQDGSSRQSLTVTQPGKYFVTVTDTNGCVKSDTVTLTKTNSPIIDIGDDTTLCVRSKAVYGLNDRFAVYEWSTGSNEPKIEVSDSGYYVLKVIDDAGCSGYDTVYVTVDPDALPNLLYVPNAFSPNGDDLNEFFPYSNWIPQPEYRVRTWNRWGEKLFDSKESETQFWDGNYKGKLVEGDAFIWVVEYRACNGQNKRHKGTVNIMR